MADNKSYITKGEFDTELNKKLDKFQYSTDEVDTGNKWIDGKTIYRIVLYVGKIITAGNRLMKDISSLNIEDVVSFKGIATTLTPSKQVRPLPGLYQTSEQYSLYIDSNVLFVVAGGFAIGDCYVILEYTKTS